MYDDYAYSTPTSLGKMIGGKIMAYNIPFFGEVGTQSRTWISDSKKNQITSDLILLHLSYNKICTPRYSTRQ